MKKFFYACLLFMTPSFGLIGCGGASDNTTAANGDSSTANVTKDWKIGVQMWTFHVAGPFVKALDKVDSSGLKFIEAFPGQPLGGDMKDTFGIRMSAASK